MAVFSGLMVSCGYAGAAGYENKPMPVKTRAVWSEAPATGVLSTNIAAAGGDNSSPVFTIWSTADAWISCAPVPDPVAGPRDFIPANTKVELRVYAGDKFKWVADA